MLPFYGAQEGQGLPGQWPMVALQQIHPFKPCRCSTSADDVPVIVVGGAAALCGDYLAGASAVIRPEHADVANAVGAAIPQVNY